MLEMIAAKLTGKAVAVAGGGVAVIASGWILKKIPNNKIKAKVGLWMYGLGVGVTLGMAKWKFTKPIWNKVIEPYFIDLIDNVVGGAIRGLTKGLKSDNK